MYYGVCARNVKNNVYEVLPVVSSSGVEVKVRVGMRSGRKEVHTCDKRISPCSEINTNEVYVECSEKTEKGRLFSVGEPGGLHISG